MITMAKLEGVRQAAMIPELAGKSFKVVKVTTGRGLGDMVFLQPKAAVGSSKGLVALKMNNAKAAMKIQPLLGKTVMVNAAPTGARKLLVLTTQKSAAAAKLAPVAAKAAGVNIFIGPAKAAGIKMGSPVALTQAAAGKAVVTKAVAGKAAVGTAVVGAGMLTNPVAVIAGVGAIGVGMYMYAKKREHDHMHDHGHDHHH